MPGMEQYIQKLGTMHGHLAEDGHSVLRGGYIDKPQEDIFSLREETYYLQKLLLVINILVGKEYS